MAESDVVEVRMRIAAKPATVFRFFSNPEQFQKWMGVPASFPGRVGEQYWIRYSEVDRASGHILELVPDRRVVFSWGLDNGKHGVVAGSTKVAIDLTPIESGTLLVLRHTGLPTKEARREHMMGWRHYVSKLGTSVASVSGLAEPALADYHAAWMETDAEKRRTILDRCWAPTAVFRDAMGYAEGGEELADYIGAAQKFAPNVRLEQDGELQHAHGFVCYPWRMVGPDGTVVMSGRNVAELSPDGLLLSVTGFWEQPQGAVR